MQETTNPMQSVIERGFEEYFGLHFTLNAPEFFFRKDFLDYVKSNPVFTWHDHEEEPGDYSDVIVLVEPCLNGEGSESDMPQDIWETIMAVLKKQFGEDGERVPPQFRHLHMAVRITNLQE